MICSKALRLAHEDVQQKIFAMLPEKWDRLYLYASVEDHFNKMQTGEMFFFYYPKGILRKRPINVYEVPAKFNIDEAHYLKLADELLKLECINAKEKPWSNVTISIENLKYKAEYGYEELNTSEFDSDARHVIWMYTYLKAPYESFNKKEREIIDVYISKEHEKKEVFELPLYKKEISKKVETIKDIEKNLTFVTDKKIEERKYDKNERLLRNFRR